MIIDLNRLKFQRGDKLKINVALYDANKGANKKFTKENFPIILGQNNYLPEFDELIIGKTIAKKYQFSKKFSNNYPIEELRNSLCKIVVQVLEYDEAKMANVIIKADQLEKEVQVLKESIKKSPINEPSQPINLQDKNKFEKLNFELNLFKQKVQELSDKIKAKNDELDEKDKEIQNMIKQGITQTLDAPKPAEPQRLTVPKEEIEKAKKYALQKFFEDFSNPFATLKVAINSGKNTDDVNVKNYVMGFEMVLGLIERVLRDHGITAVEPKVGEEFDPNSQKVLELVVDDSKPANTIIKVSAIGFKLHDRLIKPAIVVVSKLSEEKDKSKKETKKDNPKDSKNTLENENKTTIEEPQKEKVDKEDEPAEKSDKNNEIKEGDEIASEAKEDSENIDKTDEKEKEDSKKEKTKTKKTATKTTSKSKTPKITIADIKAKRTSEAKAKTSAKSKTAK